MTPIGNQLPRMCLACGGSGWKTKICPSCGGSGKKMATISSPVYRDGQYVNQGFNSVREPCSACNGSGQQETQCLMCHGSGYIQKPDPKGFGKPVGPFAPTQSLKPKNLFPLVGSRQIPEPNPVHTVNPIAEPKSHPGRGILTFLLWLAVTLWVGAIVGSPGAIIVWVLGLLIAIRAGQKARRG